MSAVHENAFPVPYEAEIVERIQESPSIFTLRLRFTEAAVQAAYRFAPGQFNMLYLFGVGEVPISIVSDPEDDHLFDHTIRSVGRVTRVMAALRPGERVGVRGPFGRGWPMAQAEGRDVVIVTGGLGCAPVMSVINYVLRRRERFGRLVIIQGVKHSDDLIWRERYEQWARLPDTQVFIAADQAGPGWPFREGLVTALLGEAELDTQHSCVMMCGPEGMMQAVARDLLARGFSERDLWLSMERNMHCGQGLCGHCQLGAKFVCKDGPVFSYDEIKHLLGLRL
ncbi:MAG: FAD/NAD(P)-binding protein [Thiohalomonadaceae bacterium]